MKYNDIYKYEKKAIAGKRVAIYGSDRDAKDFAIRLINNGIYFEYFILEKNIHIDATYIYNKRVISIQEVMEMDDIIILAPYYKVSSVKEKLKNYNLDKRVESIELLKDELSESDLFVIYGTGKRGEKIFERLSKKLNIQFFCDSSEDKWGSEFLGKKILSPDEVSAKEYNVIIASVYYEEIYEVLRERSFTQSKIYVELNKIYVYSKNHYFFLDGHGSYDFVINKLCYDLRNKRIILYGEENLVDLVADKLFLFGTTSLEKIKRYSEKEDGTIYQLLYKNMDNRLCLLVDKHSKKIVEYIYSMGIDIRKFNWFQECEQYDNIDYKEDHQLYLDPTLGFLTTSKKMGNYFGFIKYEYINENTTKMPFIIVTLGGSTTMACCVKNRSWSEYLSEILKQKGISHVIYCGGNEDYKVSQELLRLIRDVILLKPDIVLSYSGVNNVGYSVYKEHPFIHPYQKKVFEGFANSGKVKKLDEKANVSNEVYFGMKDDRDYCEHWISQLKIMNSVCKENSIIFKAFCQPTLFSKATFDGEENNILASIFDIFYDVDSKKLVCMTEVAEELYISFKSFIQASQSFHKEWFYDLSDIFDKESNIYIDNCHVFEKGNQIIAEKIYEKIENLVANYE